MIRIDELYNNTFLPRIQEKPYHGLHWFDPFGSVKFSDLCSVPPIPWDDRSVRYLFWDQEPLHRETVDATLKQFKDMYNGQHHLITSEKNSDSVEYACNTYGFTPHYYFFHGWAALDWFRGYNRSFLMPEPKDRHIARTFISPNRVIAGRRQHRLIMLYHMFKNDMTYNWISCPSVCPAENITIDTAIKDLVNKYPDIEEVFNTQALPLKFPGEYDSPMDSYRLSLFDQAAESLLYVVTETVATGRRQHLTEKIFKPICLRMPFVLVGTQGGLEYLRSYGFRTFDHLWDESYDQETDDHARYAKVAQTLKDIDELPRPCKQKLLAQAQEVVEHNYNHFYGGGFESVLWTELTGMLDEF